MTRTRGALALALVLSGCAARHVDAAAAVSAPKVATPEPPSPELSTLLSRAPDLVLTVHPPALARDPVYGPLLRRASELASAYAGPTNLGTTALAVLERTEEIVVAECDRGKEAVVALRGVPASVNPLDSGRHVGSPAVARAAWRHADDVTRARAHRAVRCGTVRRAGPGVAHRERVRNPASSRGARRRRRKGRVRGRGLTARLSVSARRCHPAVAPWGAGPGRRWASAGAARASPGAVGLIVGHLDYANALTAASAEGTVLAVTLAFRHRLEEAVQAPDGGAQGQRDAGDARRERPGPTSTGSGPRRSSEAAPPSWSAPQSLGHGSRRWHTPRSPPRS